MSSRRVVVAIASAAGLVLSSCGGDSDSATPEAPSTAPAPVAAADVTVPAIAAQTEQQPAADEAVTPQLLDFRAPLVGGGTFDAAELAGTPTVFWFWAPT